MVRIYGSSNDTMKSCGNYHHRSDRDHCSVDRERGYQPSDYKSVKGPDYETMTVAETMMAEQASLDAFPATDEEIRRLIDCIEKGEYEYNAVGMPDVPESLDIALQFLWNMPMALLGKDEQRALDKLKDERVATVKRVPIELLDEHRTRRKGANERKEIPMDDIMRRLDAGEMQKDLAKEYGISQGRLSTKLRALGYVRAVRVSDRDMKVLKLNNQGWSYSKISREMGMSISNVGNAIHRTKKKLAILEQQGTANQD